MKVAAPVALLRHAVDPATAAAWLAAIDRHPAWQHRDAACDGSFNVQSSSLRAAAIPALDPAAIANRLLQGELAAFCREHLGAALACNIDQCWVRRQYAASHYPPSHSPHAWHQDGALGFDFMAASPPLPDAGLLAMVTCWIALTECGSTAPGIEWVESETMPLLPPSAMGADAVRARHAESALQRPVMQAGDGLAFAGSVLHRTHVLPSMRQDRTSLEIRLFDAARIPARLRGDRFVAVSPQLQGIYR